MNSPQTISPIDLAACREARQRADIVAKEAELVQLRVFVRYGLGPNDTFDLQTGVITRSVAMADTGEEGPPRG